jgi:hypothetical protein
MVRIFIPTCSRKAAALLESLIGNHPYVDGNKRNGITAAGLFLRINDFRLTASDSQLEDFTLKCAQGFISFKQKFSLTNSGSLVKGSLGENSLTILRGGMFSVYPYWGKFQNSFS